ncbi:ATP-binding cassette domain-containing protein, partial [Candidatus Pelagibacter sp.]|uniref:ATP-binding cassette domain-containing protein n=1 Tax=Candidatus Pelagibacter sp. TaxID=2024849 RepID=UPI003F8480B0
LNKDYLFFIKNSSSFFNSNIIKEVDNFAMKLMDSLIYLLTDTVIILTIITFLMISYPYETSLLFFISSGMFTMYYIFFRKKLKKLGTQVTKFTSSRVRFLEDSFYIVQNIKIDQSEKFFIKKFREISFKTSENLRKIAFIVESPKSLIELTMLLVIFVLLLNFSFFFEIETSKFISLIGLFVFGMFRILPSYNRVLLALNNIKAHYGCIQVIKSQLVDYDEVVEKEKVLTNENTKSFNKIKLENIYFEYNKNNPILENVNFETNRGEIIGILGENGSGKSTLLNILCGLIVPQKGSILLDGNKPKSYDQIIKGKIGYIPQKIYLSDDTIKNNITLGKNEDEINNDSYEKAIKLSRLDDVINKLNEKENTRVGERGIKLSGGQQQRIGLARAIYKNPEILILDEATNALDFETEMQILNKIKGFKDKMFIFLVSHNKKNFEICDKILELKSKRIHVVK